MKKDVVPTAVVPDKELQDIVFKQCPTCSKLLFSSHLESHLRTCSSNKPSSNNNGGEGSSATVEKPVNCPNSALAFVPMPIKTQQTPMVVEETPPKDLNKAQCNSLLGASKSWNLIKRKLNPSDETLPGTSESLEHVKKRFKSSDETLPGTSESSEHITKRFKPSDETPRSPSASHRRIDKQPRKQQIRPRSPAPYDPPVSLLHEKEHNEGNYNKDKNAHVGRQPEIGNPIVISSSSDDEGEDDIRDEREYFVEDDEDDEEDEIDVEGDDDDEEEEEEEEVDVVNEANQAATTTPAQTPAATTTPAQTPAATTTPAQSLAATTNWAWAKARTFTPVPASTSTSTKTPVRTTRQAPTRTPAPTTTQAPAPAREVGSVLKDYCEYCRRLFCVKSNVPGRHLSKCPENFTVSGQCDKCRRLVRVRDLCGHKFNCNGALIPTACFLCGDVLKREYEYHLLHCGVVDLSEGAGAPLPDNRRPLGDIDTRLRANECHRCGLRCPDDGAMAQAELRQHLVTEHSFHSRRHFPSWAAFERWFQSQPLSAFLCRKRNYTKRIAFRCRSETRGSSHRCPAYLTTFSSGPDAQNGPIQATYYEVHNHAASHGTRVQFSRACREAILELVRRGWGSTSVAREMRRRNEFTCSYAVTAKLVSHMRRNHISRPLRGGCVNLDQLAEAAESQPAPPARSEAAQEPTNEPPDRQKASKNRRMATQGRRKVTQGRQKATKDRQKATKDRREATKDRQEATKDRQEATKDRQEATKDRHEATKDRQEATKDRQEASDGAWDSDGASDKSPDSPEWLGSHRSPDKASGADEPDTTGSPQDHEQEQLLPTARLISARLLSCQDEEDPDPITEWSVPNEEAPVESAPATVPVQSDREVPKNPAPVTLLLQPQQQATAHLVPVTSLLQPQQQATAHLVPVTSLLQPQQQATAHLVPFSGWPQSDKPSDQPTTALPQSTQEADGRQVRVPVAVLIPRPNQEVEQLFVTMTQRILPAIQRALNLLRLRRDPAQMQQAHLQLLSVLSSLLAGERGETELSSVTPSVCVLPKFRGT